MYVYILNFFFLHQLLIVFFFASFFFLLSIYLLAPEKDFLLLSKALVSYCFLVFRRTGEYIFLDLFYFVNFTSSCSLIPPISSLFRSSRHGCLIFLGALNPQITREVVWILNVE